MRTYQFRRYELEEALAEEFVTWAVTKIFPLREQFGYKVEWSYFDRSNSEFVWMASAECSQEEFEAKDAAWLGSEERAKAAVSMPQALIKLNASFVEKV